MLPFLVRKRESSRYTLPWTDSLRFSVVICVGPFEIFGQRFFRCLFSRLWFSCLHVSLSRALPGCARFYFFSSLSHTMFVCLWLKALLVLVGAHTVAHAHTHTRWRYIIKFRYRTVNRELYYYFFVNWRGWSHVWLFLYMFYVNFHWEPNRWVLW